MLLTRYLAAVDACYFVALTYATQLYNLQLFFSHFCQHFLQHHLFARASEICQLLLTVAEIYSLTSCVAHTARRMSDNNCCGMCH